MTEEELNAMLAAYVGDDYGTHWDTCHHDGNPRQHAGCAVSKLVAEVRRLRADLKYSLPSTSACGLTTSLTTMETTMTPTEKLMQKVIYAATGEIVHDPAEVRTRYQEMEEDRDTADARYDAESNLRGCGEPTGLPCDYSRHYASKSVAAEMLDGSWVGWTYWYGGGKHGEPSEMPWMEDAYEVATEVVMEPVRKFRRIGG